MQEPAPDIINKSYALMQEPAPDILITLVVLTTQSNMLLFCLHGTIKLLYTV